MAKRKGLRYDNGGRLKDPRPLLHKDGTEIDYFDGPYPWGNGRQRQGKIEPGLRLDVLRKNKVA